MSVTDRQLRELLGRCWSGSVAWDEPLAKWSSLRVGGPARALVKPASVEAVRGLIMGCVAVGLPWLVIGGGTNLLVSEAGFPGVVLVLGRDFGGVSECGIDQDGRCLVEVQAGCSLARLLGWSQRRGLGGLEYTVGIPGSVGGAVVMNAGAWGREIKDILAGLQWLLPGGEIEHRERQALEFSYRRWSGPVGALVLNATFALIPADPAGIKALCREYLRGRRDKQPHGVASAGSFFKNPAGDYAGRLIEAAGLKGLTVGGATVSAVHANFLVNTGRATATEMLALMRLVQEKVMARSGVWLEPEVRIVDESGRPVES
jgi:UDP-N-acetylmuramate dehydrogenase